jgi:hypothetical protein
MAAMANEPADSRRTPRTEPPETQDGMTAGRDDRLQSVIPPLRASARNPNAPLQQSTARPVDLLHAAAKPTAADCNPALLSRLILHQQLEPPPGITRPPTGALTHRLKRDEPPTALRRPTPQHTTQPQQVTDPQPKPEHRHAKDPDHHVPIRHPRASPTDRR